MFALLQLFCSINYKLCGQFLHDLFSVFSVIVHQACANRVYRQEKENQSRSNNSSRQNSRKTNLHSLRFPNDRKGLYLSVVTNYRRRLPNIPTDIFCSFLLQSVPGEIDISIQVEQNPVILHRALYINFM